MPDPEEGTEYPSRAQTSEINASIHSKFSTRADTHRTMYGFSGKFAEFRESTLQADWHESHVELVRNREAHSFRFAIDFSGSHELEKQK